MHMFVCSHICLFTHMHMCTMRAYIQDHAICTYTCSCAHIIHSDTHPSTCTYAYIQTDRHMPTHTCTHGHTYTHIHIDRMFIYTYTHAHSHVHMHTHTHTSKHTHSHMYTWMYMHTHSHILTHCTHFPSVPGNSKKPFRAGVTNLCLVGLDLSVDKHYHAGGWALLGAPLNFFL